MVRHTPQGERIPTPPLICREGDSVLTLTLTITPSERATFSYDTTSYCSVNQKSNAKNMGTTGGV